MEAVGFFLLGLTAWLVALFGPPFLALWFWRRATGAGKAWLAHLLFLPCVLGMEWVTVRAIFFAAHDDGDGPPGLGLLLILPFALLAGSIAIYYLAVGWQILRRALRLARGS
jgi:hypothetical protein